MGFLTPALLALAAGIAAPILLHLLHRSEGRRVSFPALRYLLRTEKDHARRIRTRQLLLLVLRCSVILLLALAGARMVLRGSGPAHPPTAVAILLDNSMSSGRVVGEGRVLDTLKTAALATVDQAGAGDRFWVLRVGEPWDIATPLAAGEARSRILETTVSGALGDLTGALDRAVRLLESAETDAREVHLVSDLQASAFSGSAALGELPVVVFRGISPPGPNRYVRGVTLGGGLPPRANRRTEAAVSVGGPEGDSALVPVRVVLQEQLRGAASTPVEGTAVLPVGPFPQGRLEGYAETDPDELRADDRFFVSLTVEPPPGVAVVGDPGPFVTQALDVLESGGRLQRTAPAPADVLLLEWGQGLESLRPGQRAVVIPGADPTLRPALNRRLAESGIALALEPGPGGGRTLDRDLTGSGLQGIQLQATREIRGAPAPEVTVWARRDDGVPWLVSADLPDADVVLLASRLDPSETRLPLEAAMVPLVEWLVSGSRGAGATRRVEAGTPLALSVRATEVVDAAGTRFPVDGTHEFRFTGAPGLYTVLAGEEVLDRVAVNAPLRESLLRPLSDPELADRLVGSEVRIATSLEQWEGRVFTRRLGREVWPVLLGLALALLLLESWVAASGATERTRPPRSAPAQSTT